MTTGKVSGINYLNRIHVFSKNFLINILRNKEVKISLIKSILVFHLTNLDST